MDLWNLFARLWRNKFGLALVAVVSLVLGVVGWVSSAPSYSMTASQALRSTDRNAAGEVVTTTGTFELGMIGAMVVQNMTDHAGAFGDTTVTSTNAIVSPPSALPLVTTSVTARSAEEARSAMEATRRYNREFLQELFAQGRAPSRVQLVDLPYEPNPVVSPQPRIRSAGIGVILGALGGLTLLLIIDALRGRRGSKRPHPVERVPVSR